jgi:hypothetical protein
VSLTSSVNPSVFGQAVTFTAIVSVRAGTPTGTVTFKVGDTVLGTGRLATPAGTSGSGTATFRTSTLPVGSQTIIAVYEGDSSFTGSTSPALTQTVNKANSSTSLRSSANPSMAGATVTFTATVSAVAPGAGSPTGTVIFVVDGGAQAALDLDATSKATFRTATLSAGTHTIVALYQGDANFNQSASPPLTQVVNRIDTRTAINSDPNPSTAGEFVTLTATVSAGPPGTGTPTGNVRFQEGDTIMATRALDASGRVTFVTSTLSVGTHLITAVYQGDSTYAGSMSPLLVQIVKPGPATHFRVSAPSSTTAGQSFSATVTALDAYENIATGYTGTVGFTSTDAQTTLPNPYPFTATDGGMHTFTVTLRTAGGQTLTASDSVLATLIGSAPVQVVAAAAASLRMVPAQNVIYPGQPFAMTVTAYDAFGNIATGYRGTVHFTTSDPSGSVPPDYQFSANDNGTHTFMGFILVSPGDQTFTVADTMNPALTVTLLFQFHGP